MTYLTNGESATVLLKRRDKVRLCLTVDLNEMLCSKSPPKVVDMIQDRLARGETLTKDIPLNLARSIQYLRR